MVKYVPLSPTAHAGKSWNLPSLHYGFASRATFVAVVGAEIANVATNMPMAFIKDGEQFQLVGLLSYHKGHNLFVRPDGRWIGGYIPAAFRAYPFRFLRPPGTDKSILCIDEESGLLEDGKGTEPFFDEVGKPSKSVAGVIAMLEAVEKSRVVTAVAVRALETAGVIVPWELEVKDGRNETQVQGLYRVDEQLLQKLDDEAFLGLRKAGALPLAFAQLISMARLSSLVNMASEVQKRPSTPPNAITLSDFFGDPESALLKF